MANGRAWTIKSVRERTRDAALAAAHGAGLTVGEWVDQALARAAAEARHPQPPAATREDVAGAVRERLTAQLAPLTERIETLAERLASIEARISRPATPERLGVAALLPSPVEALRLRLRMRRQRGGW